MNRILWGRVLEYLVVLSLYGGIKYILQALDCLRIVCLPASQQMDACRKFQFFKWHCRLASMGGLNLEQIISSPLFGSRF
jgi:hypothetical protein